MIKDTLLAVSVASGLIVPVAAGVYLPPKPAIIRPENIEFSKHMLLAMPMTMGMLTKKSVAVSNISFISAASAQATTVTLGTHAAGDIIIIIAGRATNTIPTLPAGWTNINTASNTNFGSRIGYKVAASSSETSGTWTNAQQLVAVVYRGVASIGTNNSSVGAFVTSATTPAITLSVTNNTSWVLGGWTVGSAITGQPNEPSGTTSRHNSSRTRAWDSGGAVSGTTFAATSSTMSGQSFGGGVVELVST